MTRRAQAVIGAAWGDEGKGLLTDALARPDTLVVRFNGGAQAGHTVTAPDGRRHVFHGVGSGTFRGAATFLSRFHVHNPLLHGEEVAQLRRLGLHPRVLADPQGMVTTPWDMMLNQIAALLAQSDVFVHGYRPGSLDRLGLDAAARQRLRPGLIDVSLDAYGWNGPWAGRRGFDSLVQMSAGVADKGMQVFRADRPKPLPVQALDHAAGYVMAAAVLRGLALRLADRRGFRARTSLARMALALTSVSPAGEGPAFSPFTDEDCARATETTAWGLARRLGAPLAVEGAPMAWRLSASPLGSAPAEWPAWR